MYINIFNSMQLYLIICICVYCICVCNVYAYVYVYVYAYVYVYVYIIIYIYNYIILYIYVISLTPSKTQLSLGRICPHQCRPETVYASVWLSLLRTTHHKGMIRNGGDNLCCDIIHICLSNLSIHPS